MLRLILRHTSHASAYLHKDIAMSNLTQRILVAIVAIPLIVLICMLGGVYFFGFIALVSAVALHEFYAIARAKGARPMVGAGIVAGFFVNLSFFHPKLLEAFAGGMESVGMPIPFPSQAQLLLIVLILSVAILIVIELFRSKASSPLLNLSTTILGVACVSLFLGSFIGIRELFTPLNFPMLRYVSAGADVFAPAYVDQVYRWGGYTVISIFATIWICDTAAFHAGTVMGTHKLYPAVSPNKSWEGAIAGFLAAIATAVAAKFLVLPYLSVGSAVIIGIIVGVFGQIGDLAESMLKRDVGVKDSSTLIPGHGGAFDRFDSLLLVSPLVYLYLDFIIFS
jgi:phosphatidate cytidylyltransferase